MNKIRNYKAKANAAQRAILPHIAHHNLCKIKGITDDLDSEVDVEMLPNVQAIKWTGEVTDDINYFISVSNGMLAFDEQSNELLLVSTSEPKMGLGIGVGVILVYSSIIGHVSLYDESSFNKVFELDDSNEE